MIFFLGVFKKACATITDNVSVACSTSSCQTKHDSTDNIYIYIKSRKTRPNVADYLSNVPVLTMGDALVGCNNVDVQNESSLKTNLPLTT